MSMPPPAAAETRPNLDLDEALADAEARYAATRPRSRAAFERATEAMPGANTRTALYYPPFPAVIARGEGARLVDLDGHTYVDLLGEYSAALYGHSHPVITAAVREALEEGVALGGPNRYEGPLAAEICRRFAGVDLVRFANSGTEANLFAIAAARLHTGRPGVMVFDHGYHGGVLTFPGDAPEHRINVPYPWVVAPFNDLDGTLALLERRGDGLAAVLVEPMQGGGGTIPAERDFLRGLREACTRRGVVLILDEVMTSRSSAGGLQARLGVVGDMTTLGKHLGGGLTLSAFGGRADIMARFDPRGPGVLPHAGTFNNNVLAMAAGLAGLTRVATPAALDAHFARGERLKERLNGLARDLDVPSFTATGAGTILTLHCVTGPLRHGRDLDARDPARRDRLQRLLHLDLLERGHYVARRGYVAPPMPLEPTDEDAFVQAVEEFLNLRRGLLLQ